MPALPDLEILPATNGTLTLKAGGIWLEDPEDPGAAAVASIHPSALEGVDVTVLFGHGLGYRLMRLKDLGAKNILVFEPDPDLSAWVSEHLPEVLEGVTVVHDLRQLSPLFEGGPALRVYRPAVIGDAGYRAVYPELFEKVLEIVRNGWAMTGSQVRTLRDRIPLILEEGLAGFGAVRGAVAVSQVPKVLAGKTAFVVSAGPSLDHALPLLAAAAERGVILTNNTALPALVKQGIRVDLLVVVDSQSKARPEGYESVRSIALDLGVDPALHHLPLPRMVFHQQGLLGGLGREIAPVELEFGPSVATAGVVIAETLGAETIVLVGQDCAYPGGRCYASGLGRDDYRVEVGPQGIRMHRPTAVVEQYNTWVGEKMADYVARIEVPEWSGKGTVYTSPDLEGFRRWFANRAATVAGPRRWNATGGGARIDGWESVPLSWVLEQLPVDHVDLPAAIHAAPPIDADRLLARRREAGEKIAAGLEICRGLLNGSDGARVSELRAILQEFSAWEIHSRGWVYDLKEDHGPMDVIRLLVRSAERLLPLMQG